jgi:NAD(P)-dependent dehydrogenase (short-subunit alcohol dehydrogenase family)
VSLVGRAVIVTGAARGLGREYAQLFAGDGALVAVADVDKFGVEETVEAIGTSRGRAHPVALDVTDVGSTVEMAEEVRRVFGRIDVLVNNAGVWGDLQRTTLGEIEPSYFDHVMAVNLKGPLLCSKAVLPAMREQGFGRIVNISSIGAYMVSGVYGVSKLALNQLTFALAAEVGSDGITVNAVAPGTIANEATRRQVNDAVIESLVNRAAIKRAGTAEDMYGMIRYLASEEAAWVTGQTISVNGGYSSRL